MPPAAKNRMVPRRLNSDLFFLLQSHNIPGDDACLHRKRHPHFGKHGCFHSNMLSASYETVQNGYNRRRRLATGRSGKQQAGRTAVRTAPIVCPEESPLLAATIDNFAVSNSPKGLQPYGALDCFGRRTEGDWGERKATLLASIDDNFAVRNSPLAGLDAPTPARIGTGRPKGRSHFSFGGERKVCKRKPAARRLREKGFYCPF